jgi:hypothetical protein
MNDLIGLILAEDDTLVAIINPDNDYELNDVWLRQIGRVVAVPRGDYGAILTLDDIGKLIEQYRDTDLSPR